MAVSPIWFSEYHAKVFDRVDHHHAVFAYHLHHHFHDILRDRHAAARIGLDRAEAVQEDGGTAPRCSFFVEADVQTILILVVI